MKKTYIMPESEVIQAVPMRPITDPSVNVDPTDPGIDPSEFEAKRGYFDSDESENVNLWED